MKIGIVLGSIRDHRKGESVARWVLDNCPAREGVDFEIIDVSGFDLPLLSDETLPAMRGGSYDDPRVQSFADRIAGCDGYIFVTAEYNHGIPGAFKNAIDLLGPELFGKPVAFVSYGALLGARAVEQWRLVLANFNMFDIRNQVMLSIFTDFDESGVAPKEGKAKELTELVDVLVPIAAKLAA